MSLIRELRKSYIGRVQRKILINHRLHIITIRDLPHGYRLLRSVLNTWNDTLEIEQAMNFIYLTDLFAFAKHEGFFEEIDPKADDWIGEMEPPPPLTEEEERNRLDAYISSWEGAHPGEALFYEPLSSEKYYEEYYQRGSLSLVV